MRTKPHPDAIPLDGAGVGNIWVGLIEVTPGLAARWLKSNIDNRRLRRAKVAEYAQQMTGGHWLLTHQGVAFDEDSTLIDGQHRLGAIVKADRPQTILVTWGWSRDTKVVLDQGLNRTETDVVNAEYAVGVSTNALAGLKAMEGGLGSIAHKRRIPRQTVVDMVGQYADVIAFVQTHLLNRNFPGKAITRPWGRASLLAAVMRAWLACPTERDRLVALCNVIVTGEVEDAAADRVGVLLRNHLIATLGTETNRTRRAAYLTTEWAIRSFLDRRPVTELAQAAGELFPLPATAAPAPAISPRATRLVQEIHEAADDLEEDIEPKRRGPTERRGPSEAELAEQVAATRQASLMEKSGGKPLRVEDDSDDQPLARRGKTTFVGAK